MRRAYTLLETILALVMVALISLGVSAILQTAAYGTSTQRDQRRVVTRSEALRTRVHAAIRNARAVLAAGTGYIVLWTGDTNPDGRVNASEICFIELPSGSTTLTAYWGQYTSGEPAYAVNTNFYSLAVTLRSTGQLRSAVWATGVSGLSVRLDNTSPILAKLVTWSLTLSDRQLQTAVVGASGLGAPSQPR